MNEIPHNIADRLKRKREEESKTMAELSEEVGIPRSSLQNLMKGEKALRTDMVELIAEKLDISIGELVLGEPIEYRLTLRTATAFLSREIHTLPEPFRSAATAMLHSLEELLRLNGLTHADDSTDCLNYCSRDDSYRYFVHESRLEPRYGLVVKKNAGGNWITVAVAPGISDDFGSVLELARDCTKAQFPPGKLVEVVADFPL